MWDLPRQAAQRLDAISAEATYEDEKYDPVIDTDPKEMETPAATAIVENNYHIRSRAIHLFRSVVGFHLKDLLEFLVSLELVILKWGKEPMKRLDLANEWMIRSFMAEKLNVKKQFVFKLGYNKNS